MFIRVPQFLFKIFAGCLFHCRQDDSDLSKYSLNTANYPALPLYMYDPDYPVQHTSLLNKVFWKVLQDLPPAVQQRPMAALLGKIMWSLSLPLQRNLLLACSCAAGDCIAGPRRPRLALAQRAGSGLLLQALADRHGRAQRQAAVAGPRQPRRAWAGQAAGCCGWPSLPSTVV